MTSKLTGRIVKLEKRTGPVDIAKWMHLPVDEMPDWVLWTIILDHPVSPAEADVLEKIDGVDRQIELIRDAEEADERYVIRRGLIGYLEGIQHHALQPVRSTERAH